jgi:hypothetical protein
VIKTYSMEDTGTRLQHLMELQDVWSTAYAMLTTKRWHSQKEKNQAEELNIALELLAHAIMNEYSELGLARTINDLPKAEDIRINNTGESNYNEIS